MMTAQPPIVLWADELFSRSPVDACPCGRRVAWRLKASGERICGVCHPGKGKKNSSHQSLPQGG